ncbi:MAG: IGHMBP2 family helicase [Lacipirellulaceae bacterium]
MSDHRVGIGGRHLFTLVKRSRNQPMPWTRLRAGSPVVLSSELEGEGLPQSGVVSGTGPGSIEVAVERWVSSSSIDVDLAADEITRNRERAALVAARDSTGRVAELRRVLLGELRQSNDKLCLPQFREPRALPDERIEGLDPTQQQAVRFALTALDIAVVHGPPGTGKTTTVVEFIRQAVLRGDRVLACAPSNTAVDNLLERLANHKLRVVRLGHPARVRSALESHTLDAMVDNHPNARWIKELFRDADALHARADRDPQRGKPNYSEKAELRKEAQRLKGEARRLERQAMDDVLDQSDVVCATTSLDDGLLGGRRFDWAVIDEACQATEPACWAPLLRCDRVLLAGDHCQLPPTVLSAEAQREGYGRSMMQRLVEAHGETITRRLGLQYRMHEAIMRFSSREFYDGALEADSSVASHLLSDLAGVAETPMTGTPLEYVDTAGADFDEEPDPDGASRRNPQEGRLVLRLVDELLSAGVPARDVAVIAPYAAQVRWLRDNRADSAVEVDTVDGFQGREKEAVVISMVRSNREGEIGFLADTRRMNVAMTRARRKLIVVGDSATLGGNPFYKDLLDYFAAENAYGSVWEHAE